MSRRKSNDTPGGFARLFKWTLALSLVFSAGLITGQRLLLAESLSPLVSVPEGMPALSATARKPPRSEGGPVVVEGEVTVGETEVSAPPKRPALTFYDQLARPTERIRRVDPPASAAKVSAVVAKPAPTQAPPTAPTVAPSEAPRTTESPSTVPAAKPEAVHVATHPARYTLQVGAHPSLESARGEMERLRKLGHEPHVISAQVPGQGTFYRVRIGKFQSMDEARAFQSDLQQRASLDTFVTPL
jgi:DedD protein